MLHLEHIQALIHLLTLLLTFEYITNANMHRNLILLGTIN